MKEINTVLRPRYRISRSLMLEIPAAFDVQRGLVGDDIRMRAVRTAGPTTGGLRPRWRKSSVLLETARF